MSGYWRYCWASCLPKWTAHQAAVLLSALLVLLLFGINSRIVASLKTQPGRCRESRIPRTPRHILPVTAYKVSCPVRSPRQPADLPDSKSDTEAYPGVFSFCTKGGVPSRISSELTKPDYLKLFWGPQQQSSLPS